MYHEFLRGMKRIWPLLILMVLSVIIFADTAQLAVTLFRLSSTALLLVAAHYTRKMLFPYLDLKVYSEKAKESPLSAALIFMTVIVFIMFLCFITVSHASEADVLSKAKPYMHTFKTAVRQHWPDAPHQEYFPGKVEQETCANMAKCWNPKTELKTSREYGFSFSQMTIAYDSRGNVRFNKFDEAKHKYRALAEWKWDDRYNPRYHFTFITLEARRLYTLMKPHFRDDVNRWAAAMVSYNAGSGVVLDRRAQCSFTSHCDRQAWFGGLDTVMLPGETRLLYGRPLYERRNEYPENIIHRRSAKYIPLWRAA